MKWKNPKDEITLENSISSNEERKVFSLIKDFSFWWEPGKNIIDFKPAEALSPSAIGHALMLLCESFEEGDQLFENLDPFSRLLLSAHVSFVLAFQNEEAEVGVD